MNHNLIGLVVLLIVSIWYSFFWGQIVSICLNSSYIMNIARFVMKYTKRNLDSIRLYLAYFFYIVISLFGLVFFSIIFKINVMDYFILKKDIFVYVLLGFFAELSLSSLVIMIIVSISRKIDWIRIIKNTKRDVLPLTSALFETLFFRGIIFIFLLDSYPNIRIVWSVVLVSVLYIVHQIAHCPSVIQSIIITI